MASIVSEAPRQHVFVSRYYYLIFPAMAKCLVDVDPAARQLSRNLLQDLLKQATTASMATTSASQQQSSSLPSLRPQIPLLIAYILSALNSLDRPTRMDGAKTLIILFQPYDNKFDGTQGAQSGNYDREGDASKGLAAETHDVGGGIFVDLEDLCRLLPALVGLLSADPHQQYPLSNGQQQLQNLAKRKQSTKSSPMASDRCVVLQALVSVLRAVEVLYNGGGSHSARQPHRRIASSNYFDYYPANSNVVKGSSVALLQRHQSVTILQQNTHASRRAVQTLQSISNISDFSPERYEHHSPNSFPLVPHSVVTELISKLCDHLVETTQAGGLLRDDAAHDGVAVGRITDHSFSNNFLGKHAMEELQLVITSIHMVWISLGRAHGYDDDETSQDILKQWRKLQSLLQEIFPIVSQEHPSQPHDDISPGDRLNLTICTLITEISSRSTQLVEDNQKSFPWMGPILEYLLQRVERPDKETSSGTTATAVQILSSLMLLRSYGHHDQWFLSTKNANPY